MIRMMVRQDDLAHLPPGGDHLINTRRQRLLFFFIRRAGIEDQQLFGSMHQVAASVSCGRTRRRAHRETEIVWSKRNLTLGDAVSLLSRQKSIDEIRGHSVAERFQRV